MSDVAQAIADAEARGYTAGRKAERAAVVAWLRVTPRVGGTLVSIAASQDIARLADGIERGEHALTAAAE